MEASAYAKMQDYLATQLETLRMASPSIFTAALNIIQRARQHSDPESSGQKIMAPIVDIRLVTGKEPTPEGFTRHVICLSGRKRQAKVTKKMAYVCVARGLQRPPITGIRILVANDNGFDKHAASAGTSGGSMDSLPTPTGSGQPVNATEEKDEAGSGQTATMPLGGHVIVETPAGNKADLGGLGRGWQQSSEYATSENSSHEMLLCVSRDGSTPLMEISVVAAQSSDTVVEECSRNGFQVITRSVRGFPAVLHGTSYLCCRYDLTRSLQRWTQAFKTVVSSEHEKFRRILTRTLPIFLLVANLSPFSGKACRHHRNARNVRRQTRMRTMAESVDMGTEKNLVEEETKPPRLPNTNTESEAAPEPTEACPYVVALQTLKALLDFGGFDAVESSHDPSQDVDLLDEVLSMVCTSPLPPQAASRVEADPARVLFKQLLVGAVRRRRGTLTPRAVCALAHALLRLDAAEWTPLLASLPASKSKNLTKLRPMASLEVLTELLSALEDDKTIIRDSIREAPAAFNVRNRATRTSTSEFENVAANRVVTADTGGNDGESGNDTQPKVDSDISSTSSSIAQNIDFSALSPKEPSSASPSNLIRTGSFGRSIPQESGHRGFIRELVDNLVTNAATGAVIQATLKCCARQQNAPSLPLFTANIQSLSSQLFSINSARAVYTFFAAFCRSGMADMGDASFTGLSDSAVRRTARWVCLQTILGGLKSCGETFMGSLRFCLMVRRLVCTLITCNIMRAVEDSEQPPALLLFSSILNILSVLWRKFRTHTKLEFQALWEGVLKLLLESPHSNPSLKVAVIGEIAQWCDVAPHIVDMFHNFDNDTSGVSRLLSNSTLFKDLTDILFRLATGNAEDEGVTQQDTKGTNGTVLLNPIPFAVRKQALKCLNAIIRSIMDAAAHAYILDHQTAASPCTPRTYSLSMKHGGWIKNERSSMNSSQISSLDTVPEDGPKQSAASTPESDEPSLEKDSDDQRTGEKVSTDPISQLMEYTQELAARKRKAQVFYSDAAGLNSEARRRHAQKAEAEGHLDKALEIANKTNSLRKPIKLLVATNVLQYTPHDVSRFLHVFRVKLKPSWIGDYLGQVGKDAVEREFLNQVRHYYVRGLSFSGLDFVSALRRMFAEGGFSLPKESRQIERIIEAFAEGYHSDNPSVFSCPDTAFFLAYSTMLLQTGLHNPRVKKPMTLEQWIDSNKGCDPPPAPDGKDLPRVFLKEIYESLLDEGIAFDGPAPALPDGTDKDKRRKITSARLKRRGSSITRRNSISSGLSGLSLSTQTVTVEAKNALLTKFCPLLRRGVRHCQAVILNNAFVIRDYHTGITADIVRLQFEVIWLDVMFCIEELRTDQKPGNADLVDHALQLLQHCLSTSLFLGLTDQRRAFGTLLYKMYTLDSAKSKLDRQHSTSEAVQSVLSKQHETTKWFQDLMATSNQEQISITIGRLHGMFQELRSVASSEKELQKMMRLQQQIANSKKNKGISVITDSRRLLREGMLTKKSRTGKYTQYKFFLFTDSLMYATVNPRKSSVKVHQILDFRPEFRISEPPTTTGKVHQHSFHIDHPIKKIILIAPSATVKQNWFRHIQDSLKMFRRQNRGAMSESAPEA